MKPPVEQQLLGLARTELPAVTMIFDPADAHADDGIGEARVIGRDDQVAWPGEHEAGGNAGALHRCDRRLRKIAPFARNSRK